jgi:hypothetical protein
MFTNCPNIMAIHTMSFQQSIHQVSTVGVFVRITRYLRHSGDLPSGKTYVGVAATEDLSRT